MVSVGIPEAGKPYLDVLVAYRLDGNAGIRRAVRAREDGELRAMTVHIARCARLLPHFLEALGLPQLDGPEFWVGQILPAMKKELQRRERPQVLTRSGSPIAKLKALDITQVTERFTKLEPAGSGKLKGLCPLHSEKTASLYIYEESQRWRCFGACATGGDVVDLLERLSAQGALS